MVEIQRAAPGDFLDIAALDRAAWRTNRHPEFIPDGEHVWRIWCEHALTFVARAAGRTVGAILAFPCAGGSYCLHKVMVDESFRARGVGSRLCATLLEEIDRLGVRVFLTVDPANSGALKLYAKWGFSDRRLEPGFYRPSEDRYVLTRPAPAAAPARSAGERPGATP